MATASEIATTLAAYKSARDEILAGRVGSVQVEGQSYTMHAVGELEKQIAIYENRLAVATPRTGNRANGLGIRGRLGGMGY
ncbi:MAG: hypothetical protein RL456_1805 [Pseudomonadota bacterium]|jgi:hypothetical protein